MNELQNELESFRKPFEQALMLLLHRWSVWSGDDEIRALNIGFDSFNTEICVSLLTDREPGMQEQGVEPLEEPWPVGDWRLNSISSTGTHCFPDAAPLIEWMERCARDQCAGASGFSSGSFDEELKEFFYEVATGKPVLNVIKRFRRVSVPFRIRVQWFFEQSPSLEYEMR